MVCNIKDRAGSRYCCILEPRMVSPSPTLKFLAYLRDYEKELIALFGRVDPMHFQAPCFGSPIDWTRIQVSEGEIETIKKLLCIIGHAHPQLEYTPLIPAIVAILTKYMGPSDVLACMASMIEGHAIPASKRADWAYFPLHRRDYLVFERVFEDLLRTFVPKVSKHLSKLQLQEKDYAPAWDKVLSELFISFLPWQLVVRIFDSYLVEGYKILLRYAIAHVIIRQSRLLTCSRGEVFDHVLGQPVAYDELLVDMYYRTAMTVKFERSLIQRYRNRRRKHSIGDFDSEDKLLVFHRPLPHLIRPSSFLKDEHWVQIWSWIPPRYRLLNLDLAFSTVEHGRHLLNIFDRCQGAEPLLMAIETISGKVIGAYLSKALTTAHGHRFYGTGESFLFSLTKGSARKYEWDIKSGSMAFICATESFLALGTGVDFGLWIDKYLMQVTSSPSVTFANPPLVSKGNPEDLRIHCLEVFRFL